MLMVEYKNAFILKHIQLFLEGFSAMFCKTLKVDY